MVSFHHTVTVNASPDQIFQVYADVVGWKTWDPEVEWSTLDVYLPRYGGRIGYAVASSKPAQASNVTGLIPPIVV